VLTNIIQVKIWALSERGGKKWTPVQVIKAQDAATAVAFEPSTNSSRCVCSLAEVKQELTDLTHRRIAVGFEKGTISIYSALDDLLNWKEQVTVSRE
jgi:hypothetical protein